MGCFKAGNHWQKLAAALMALMAVSCHGGGWPPSGNLANLPLQQSGLRLGNAQVPLLAEIDKYQSSARSSAVDNLIIMKGKDFSAVYGPTSYLLPDEETFVLVNTGTAEANWAVYTINDLSPERPVDITVDVSEAAGTAGSMDLLPLHYWIGLSNYTKYTWDWYGPFAESTNIGLNKRDSPSDRFVSSSNSMGLIILVCPPDTGGIPIEENSAVAVGIAQIELTTIPATDSEYQPTRPHYAQLESVEVLGPGEVQLCWNHIADTANPDNSAQSYRLYRQVIGSPEPLLLGQLAAPGSTFVDPADAEAGVPEPIDGLRYRYSLQAVNPSGYTPRDTISIDIPPEIPGQNQLVITDLAIQVSGAQSGQGETADLFGYCDSGGEVQANQAVSLALEQIGGYLNGIAFAPCSIEAPPAQLEQQAFSDAFNAVASRVNWSVTHGDAENFRRTSCWLVLEEGNFPLMGNPGKAVIFPDDDPESDGHNPEGRLHLALPSSLTAVLPETDQYQIHVTNPLYYDIGFDVLPDPEAPLILGYYDTEFNPISELPQNLEGYEVLICLQCIQTKTQSYLSITALRLLSITADNTTTTKHYFSYTENAPQPGQFCIMDSIQPGVMLYCVVPDIEATPLQKLSFSINSNQIWSSINKPGHLLIVSP